MRILSFSYCYPNGNDLAWGVFVQHRLVAMAEQAELRVVSPSPWFPLTSWRRGNAGPSEESWQGLTVYRPRFLCTPKILKSHDGRFYGTSIRRWLDELIPQWKPDLLDSHFIWPDGVGVARLASHAKLPFSITLRGKIYPCLDIPSQRKQCVDALLRADQVISVDPRMAQVAEDLGVSPRRIKVISNGVDVERFHLADRNEARRKLGLPVDCRIIVTVVHLGERKGHHETIRALGGLSKDVRLVLVGGTGPLGGDEQELRQLANQVGVADQVIFAGKQPHDVVPIYYQSADLSVLASWREGCPNAVLESLACGTPVVATDVGSVRSMIVDGINGIVVPVRNVERLRDGIRGVLDRPPTSHEVRDSPAVRSWDAVADDVLQAFSTVLGRTHPEAVRSPAKATTGVN